MKAYDVVKAAAKSAGVPTTHIGTALGKSSSYVANGASRGSTPQADTLAAMLGVCGYALCAVPVGEVPPGALVVDAKGEACEG